MVFTKKFSEFAQGNVADPVGLTNGVNTIGQGGDDSSGGVIITIDQDTTGLFASRWVRFDNATQLYVPALADTAENAEVSGVVLEILSGTQFRLQQSGYIQSGTPGFSGFSTNGTYFLSDLAAGQATQTPPTENGKIRLALFNADSPDSGWICCLKSGMVIGSPGPINSGGLDPTDDTSIIEVSQAGNTFNVGEWVRVSGNKVYSLAQANNFDNSQSVGVVIDDGDPVFKIQFSGYNTGSIIGAVDALGAPIALVSGTAYYLSDTVAGAICPTKPTNTLTSVKPCYICESSTDFTGYILDQQPLEVNPGSESPNTVIVNQSTAGLAVENVMRVSASGVYTKALADTLANSRAVGIITEIIPPNHFVLQTSGFTDKFSAKIAATQYYLSSTVPGLMTTIEPTADGVVSKPIFEALTATSGYILEQRPMLQPNANGGGSSGSGGTPNLVQSFITLDNSSSGFTGDILGVSCTITPSSTSSRIRLVYTGQPRSTTFGSILIKRNGAFINEGSPAINIGISVTGGEYVDSPASTSPITYTLFVGNVTNGAAVQQLYQAGIIGLIAEEVTGSSGGVAGNVVQNVITATQVTGAGTSSICDTTITPSSSSSRILIQVNCAIASNAADRAVFLYRNGVILNSGGKNIGVKYISALSAHSVTINYIDSPATTLPVTYTLGNPTSGISVNTLSLDVSTIILQEIGA